MPRILDNFPALYASLLPELFHEELPEEKRSTCANCAMCPSAEGTPPPTQVAFLPSTKCCTRHPMLPNYAIGALLSDDSPEMAEGRRRVEAMIAARVGVWPTGLRSSNRYWLLEQSMDRSAFGQTPSLRCPYFNADAGGSCSIWAYRPAVCATYFCKPVAGRRGQYLWELIREYMADAERELICYATGKLRPEYLPISMKQIASRSKLTARDLEGLPPTDAEYANAWGPWVGREQEYYKACYEAVRALTPEEFQQVFGHKEARRMAKLRQFHAFATYRELPESVRFNPATAVRPRPEGAVAVSGYDEHDALELSAELFAVLTEFTGEEPLAAVRERLREQGRPVPGDDLLHDLVVHQVLQPV